MTATRRLAAILAVNVVGYSRLMGEEEGGRGTPRGFRAIPPGDVVRRHELGQGKYASLGLNFQIGKSTRVGDALEVALRPI
jgi:hypothetical protein